MKKTIGTIWLLGLAIVLSVTVFVQGDRASAAPSGAVGAWYVDTLGAPFTPHLFSFQKDGDLYVAFPDAAEATNSAGMGIGVWQHVTGNTYKGKFLENNADKNTNRFTSNLIVTFTVTVNGDKFDGPAQASYFGANGQLIEGPYPARLKGQRITFDSPAPIVQTS